MDYQKFSAELPKLYENWGEDDIQPKLPKFKQIIDRIPTSIAPNILQLLNLAVDCLEENEVYCEIGSFPGATLIGALLDNPETIGYAVEADISEEKLEQFILFLSEFGLDERVIFCQQTFEEFFFDLREVENHNPIGVYFYNGHFDYRSVLLALLLAKPFFSHRALIVINNTNFSTTRQANYDFIASQRECKLLLDLPTSQKCNINFGNGIQVFSWNLYRAEIYKWSSFSQIFRYQPIIQNIYDFCVDFELNKKPLAVETNLTEARNLINSGNFQAAEQKYLQALQWDDNNSQIWHELGSFYYKIQKYKKAEINVLKAIKIEPKIAEYHYTMGLIQEQLQNVEIAIKAHQNAIALDKNLVDAYKELGYLFGISHRYEAAIANYEKYLETNIGDTYLYTSLVVCYKQLNRKEKALDIYHLAIKHYPDFIDFYLPLILNLQEINQTKEAIETVERAIELFPENIAFKIERFRILPIIYQSSKEIDYYRQRYAENLDILVNEISLDSESSKKDALQALEFRTNFYLQYQGKNDLELQIKYGQLVSKIMKANYPQWTIHKSMPPLTLSGKIRVGYISKYMRFHSVGKSSLSWISKLDRQQFEIYCYYPDESGCEFTNKFQEHSDVFHQITTDLETICKQILADRLHILVFLDIGMDPLMTQLGGLRLAPIQCVRWGHPITTGLPNIDYYISNDLMEPKNGQEHYSEKLIRLPNIGKCYPKPSLPHNPQKRSYFGLVEEEIIYLSPQSSFKYLPQYDYIFPAIAEQVPDAKFVFLCGSVSNSLAEKFRHRLHQAFAKFDLNSDRYCCFLLERLNHSDYLSLNLVSDIFLDNLGWSGDNTTLEAIACNLPVVTCPGEFMRGRHAYGILQMLGVTETIARNEGEYIEIAVGLGKNPALRANIAEKIANNHSRLYGDLTCVRAVEEFYQRVVREY